MIISFFHITPIERPHSETAIDAEIEEEVKMTKWRITPSVMASRISSINALLSVVNRISLSLLLSFLKQEANLTIEEAFGEAIRELRKANQISQEKLAEVSNLDRSFISLLECGHKQPSLITIFQLAKALNLSASKILSLVEAKIKT